MKQRSKSDGLGCVDCEEVKLIAREIFLSQALAQAVDRNGRLLAEARRLQDLERQLEEESTITKALSIIIEAVAEDDQ